MTVDNSRVRVITINSKAMRSLILQGVRYQNREIKRFGLLTKSLVAHDLLVADFGNHAKFVFSLPASAVHEFPMQQKDQNHISTSDCCQAARCVGVNAPSPQNFDLQILNVEKTFS